MFTSISRQSAAIGLSTLLLIGCGGGSTSTLPSTGVGAGGGGGGVTTSGVSLGSFAAGPLAVGETRTATPTESGFSGAFTATTTNPAIVTITPASGTGPFTVSGVGAGQATITIADPSGHSASVPLTVGSISFGNISSAPFATGESRTLAPTEPGYNGTFTVTSSNPAVMSVAPASGAGPFTLTALSPGTSTITVADTLGHQASTTETVAAGTTNPNAVAVTPQSTTLNLGTLGTATVTGPVGAALNNVTATSANPAIAAAANTGNGTFQIVANGMGTTPIVFADGNGNSSTLMVNVPATSPAPPIAMTTNLANLQFAGVGQAGVLNVSEPGNTGPITVTSSNPAIVSATQIPATNQFAVTALGPGTSVLTAMDTSGRTSSIGLTAP